MPWSSISSSASVPVRSAATVQAGALITSHSGVSGPAPAATTRVRMSRSVTIPRPSPRSTTTQVTPASAIPRAASCTLVSGRADERLARGSARCTLAPGRTARRAPRPGEQAHALVSERAMKRTAAGRSSTGRIASRGKR